MHEAGTPPLDEIKSTGFAGREGVFQSQCAASAEKNFLRDLRAIGVFILHKVTGKVDGRKRSHSSA